MTRFRNGSKVGRTLYDGDTLIGLVDSTELAREIVEALNAREDLGWPPCGCEHFDNCSARPPAPVDTGPRDLKAYAEKLEDALEMAWVIVANAGGGDWIREGEEWRQAAIRWRDETWNPINAAYARRVAKVQVAPAPAPAPPTSPGPRRCEHPYFSVGADGHCGSCGADGCDPAPSPGPATEPFVDDSPGWLREELRFARQALRLLEAEAAAAREGFLRLLAAAPTCPEEGALVYYDHDCRCQRCRIKREYNAASPAGSAFLERMRRLEEVAEVARPAAERLREVPFAPDSEFAHNCNAAARHLEDALGALDAEPKEGG